MAKTAQQALEELKSGNARFVAGERNDLSGRSEKERSRLLAGQTPKAIILGCSDSRVPAEIVFDQGLGDLFVIRNAGNIVAPSQIGSVEFAVEQFQTLLETDLRHDPLALVAAAVRSNIRASVSALRHGSRFLEEEIYAGRLMIIGAEYSLESGAVEFFDND